MNYIHFCHYLIFKKGMCQNSRCNNFFPNSYHKIEIKRWFHRSFGIIFLTQLEHSLLNKLPMIKTKLKLFYSIHHTPTFFICSTNVKG